MSVVQPPERQRCVQGCLLISAFKLQPLQSQRDQIIDATQQNPFHYNILPRGLSDSPMILNHSSSMFSENALTYWNQGFVRHQLFLGRPGSEKNVLFTMLFSKAVAKGLNCTITCLSGERAQQLGGEHVQKCSISEMNNPQHMACQSINSLLKDMTRFNDLERLKVLFIDDVGQLSSEILSAMEIGNCAPKRT